MGDLVLLAKPTPDAEFLKLFNRLCVALREPADDSGITQGVYFEALKDLPVSALDRGAAALMKEPGRRFFPTTAEWRTAAERALDQQFREAVKPLARDPWHYECTDCDDTGWALYECTGDASCGRQKPHGPHRFVRVCLCRATNRTYQRHQRFGAGE